MTPGTARQRRRSTPLHDADNASVLAVTPLNEQRASAMVMWVATVERSDQNARVEEQLHRGSSSASSRSRQPTRRTGAEAAPAPPLVLHRPRERGTAHRDRTRGSATQPREPSRRAAEPRRYRMASYFAVAVNSLPPNGAPVVFVRSQIKGRPPSAVRFAPRTRAA
jgi:hypothetical protein